MASRSFLATLASLTFLVLLTFAGLQYLHMDTGTLVDWVIGVATVWWLTAVVVIPWNTHFAAKEVMEEARVSQEKGIPVPAESIRYAQTLARRFLWIAIGLHVGTAIVFYLLAYYQITAVGYLASLAALALTFLRPAQRAYEHLSYRLRSLSNQIRYPREDVAELRDRVSTLERQLEHVLATLDVEKKDSWAAEQIQALSQLRNQLMKQESLLEEQAQQNRREHENLARQSANEIAKLSEDAQFLNQVRDLVRFVKNA
jgi:hypothetical protein